MFTDPGHTQPIYLSDTVGGVVWGSSALTLAALTNAQPDTGWLAASLLVPQRGDLLAGRSAFVGITSVPPGSRLVMANNAAAQVREARNPVPARASLAEGAALLRTALSDAVGVRINEFDLLHKISSDCHLTGDGGDTLFGGHPGYLADLAQARRVRLLCRQAVGWARLRRTSVWPLLADACVTASPAT